MSYFQNLRRTSSAFLLSGLALLLASPESTQASSYFKYRQLSTISSGDDFKEIANQLKQEDSKRRIYRETLMFTYEEWKSFNHYRKSQDNLKDSELPDTPHVLELKASLMIRLPGLTKSLLSKKETDQFNSEIGMFDPMFDVYEIDRKYGLHLTPEEFQKNIGAMILWSIDRHYSYRQSTEIYKAEKEKGAKSRKKKPISPDHSQKKH